MFARVLVPVDSSAASVAALEYARMFARTFGGTLHLVHVTSQLDAALDARRGRTKVTVPWPIPDRFSRTESESDSRVQVVEGSDPAWDIVEQARALGAALIVMGTHGRRALSHVLMGSVAEAVVRRASCPVLTLRPTAKHLVTT